MKTKANFKKSTNKSKNLLRVEAHQSLIMSQKGTKGRGKQITESQVTSIPQTLNKMETRKRGRSRVKNPVVAMVGMATKQRKLSPKKLSPRKGKGKKAKKICEQVVVEEQGSSTPKLSNNKESALRSHRTKIQKASMNNQLTNKTC